MVGYGSFEQVVDMLEAALAERDYLAGDRFSAADLYVGSQLGWGMQFGTLPARPAFATYWQRLAARPAHVRATADDDMAMSPRG